MVSVLHLCYHISHTSFFRPHDLASTYYSTTRPGNPHRPANLLAVNAAPSKDEARRTPQPWARRRWKPTPSGPWVSSARAAKETWSAQAPLMCM